MPLHITESLNGQTTSIGQWEEILFESAKEHARTVVENGLADRVEIRDDGGNLVFHYPRTLRAG